jgi:hypothetical protein
MLIKTPTANALALRQFGEAYGAAPFEQGLANDPALAFLEGFEIVLLPGP